MSYKDEMQERAEEIALEKFGCDFYELSDELQYSVYTLAMSDWNNSMADRADFLNDCAKEGKL